MGGPAENRAALRRAELKRMKFFPTGRVGVVLVVCVVAGILGSVLNRFIENIGDHIALQEAAPARATAMVRPSDEHVSQYVPPVALETEPSEVTVVEGPTPQPVQVARVDNESQHQSNEPAPRWLLWLPRVEKPNGRASLPLGGGVSFPEQSDSMPPLPEAEPLGGSATGADEESNPEIFGACTGTGGSIDALIRGVASYAVGSSASNGVFSELNDFRGMPEGPGSAPAGSSGSDPDVLVPLGGAGYRGLYYASEIHLGPQDQPGLYEFSILTDQRVRLETQVAADQWETLVNGEGASGESLLCGRRYLRLHRYTWAPIRLTISDPGRGGGQTLALFWRRVEEGSRLSEPMCGSGSTVSGGAGPSTEWASFFRRGWGVVPHRALYLPGSMQSAGCPAASAGPSVPDAISFGAADGNSWTCTQGLRAARVGGQMLIDFGQASCTGSDGTRGAPGMTSCWLTPPSGVDHQAIVDRLHSSSSVQVRAIPGAECVDVREVRF